MEQPRRKDYADDPDDDDEQVEQRDQPDDERELPAGGGRRAVCKAGCDRDELRAREQDDDRRREIAELPDKLLGEDGGATNSSRMPSATMGKSSASIR